MPHSTLVRDWTSRDLSLAMADLLARDDIGRCGHPHAETTKPENADRYEVHDDLVCAACKRLDEHQAAEGNDAKAGVLLRVVDLKNPRHDEDETAFGPQFD